MTTAGQIDVKLGLNSEEFAKGVTKADSELKKLDKSLKNLGGDITSKANPAIESMTGALKKLAGPAAAAMVAKKLVDMGREAVNVAAKFESLAVSFEVLTGGAEAGKRLTDQIIELAAKTPLTTEALTDGARTLLSFGESADEVVNDLKLLGDIAGGDAQKMQSLTLAFAQVGSTGRLMGQDFLQMVNAGFNPLSIMAEKTGKSMATLKKEMSEGKITFLDVKDAMIAATSEGGRFNGMLAKQADTLEGLKSTNKSTWEQVSKAIGDFFLPAAKATQKAFIAIGEAALSALQKIKKFTEGLRFQSSESLKGSSEAFANQAKTLLKEAEYYDSVGAHKRAEWFRQKAAEYEEASKRQLDKYNELIKKEEEAAKKGKAASGFAALSGQGTDKKSTKESEAVKKAKKMKADLLAISKDYARQVADIEGTIEGKEQLGGFIGSFAAGYEKRLSLLKWYHNERFRITQTANNDITKAQEQFNQLDQLMNLKNAEINKEIWEQRGQELTQIFNNTLDSMLTNYGDFSENMQQLVLNLTRYIIKESFQSMIAQFSGLQASQGGLSSMFENLKKSVSSLSESFFGMAQSSTVATAATQSMQASQAVLAPVATKVGSQMMLQASQYTMAATACEQLAVATAKLAIAEAAASVAKIPYVGGFLAPVAAAATGAAIAAGIAAVSISSLGGAALGKAGSLIQGGKTPKFHSGGMSTQEQLAVIRKDERVLNPAETASYNAGQGGNNSGGGNNIVLFNIKAWDGKDVINTLKSNSQTINQIVASGIKNNNQGLRTTVQNT